MKKNRITLKQLALELGLSISTISKALNNSSEISEDTKQKVLDKATELGYKSNAGIEYGHKTIAVLLPDIKNDFFAQVLTGLEGLASNEGFKIITCLTNESYEKEVDYLSTLNKETIDGFIIAAAQETQQLQKYDHFKQLIDGDIPVVMFDRVIDEIECDKIVIDDYLSGARAVDALIDSGDRNICMVSMTSSLSVSKLREQGIRAQINKYEDAIFNVITSADERKFMDRVGEAIQYDGVQSFIALDQVSGKLALNKANELGVKIPEQLQIISYSDGLLSYYSRPQISVMDQHAEELGKKTFVRMQNLINNKDAIKVTRIHTLKTSLIRRETTRN
ncbi:MAG: LacI family DNA-binding transcriptional regulator [Nonlabens sp.]